MRRTTFFAYGVASHLMFLVVFAYMACFVGGVLVPKTIDAPGAGFGWQAALVDGLLIGLFGVQHSVMARPGFKAWLTKIVPTEIERSTYVLVSNVVMILLMALWVPLGPTVWEVGSPGARAAVWTLFAAGWLMIPAVSLLINHFDLFGTRQVWLSLRGRAYTHLPFRTPGLYRFVRHPLYVGWLIAFWAAPTMTLGHFLFAAMMTGYILLAIPMEERDLVELHGADYAAYRETVPALVPGFGGPGRATDGATV